MINNKNIIFIIDNTIRIINFYCSWTCNFIIKALPTGSNDTEIISRILG